MPFKYALQTNIYYLFFPIFFVHFKYVYVPFLHLKLHKTLQNDNIQIFFLEPSSPILSSTTCWLFKTVQRQCESSYSNCFSLHRKSPSSIETKVKPGQPYNKLKHYNLICESSIESCATTYRKLLHPIYIAPCLNCAASY